MCGLIRLDDALWGLSPITFAFAFVGALACRLCRQSSWLQQGMHIRANACELVQRLVEGPTLGDQLGYFVPQGAVRLQQFLRVCSAQAGGGRHGLRAEVQDLFAKGLEDREMRAVAKRDCIAKDRLLAGKPGRVEAHMLHRQLWRLVKEGRADELGFRSERAGRACLNYILVLLAGEPHLPGTHLMVPPGLNHMCTSESRRMLGVQSASRCSQG